MMTREQNNSTILMNHMAAMCLKADWIKKYLTMNSVVSILSS